MSTVYLTFDMLRLYSSSPDKLLEEYINKVKAQRADPFYMETFKSRECSLRAAGEALWPTKSEPEGSAADRIRDKFGEDTHIEPGQEEDGTINGRFL